MNSWTEIIQPTYAPPAPEHARIHLSGFGGHFSQDKKVDPRTTDRRSKVIDYLKTHPHSSATQVANDINSKVSSIKWDMFYLRDKGIVWGTPTAKKNNKRIPIFWSLV